MNAELETDYLVVGCGCMGMAFIDTILSETDHKIVVVDRREKPGGHWQDAYGFVKLHQVAVCYGLNTRPLGQGGMDLSSGDEIRLYYEAAMEYFVNTGRVEFLKLCEYEGDFTDLSNNRIVDTQKKSSFNIRVRQKIVDATYLSPEIPSRHILPFQVSSGVTCIAVNALPEAIRNATNEYVIIGGGKTGIDACLYLLNHGIDESKIQWIIPNDAWLLQRELLTDPYGKYRTSLPHRQPLLLMRMIRCIVGAVCCCRSRFHDNASNSVISMDPLVGDHMMLLDDSVTPHKYRCATVSKENLQKLKTIKSVFRNGRIKKISCDLITFQNGEEVFCRPEKVFVDCSADGLATRAEKPIFTSSTIVLQNIYICQPSFSGAAIAYVEATCSENEKNYYCAPVPNPQTPADAIVVMTATNVNMAKWGINPVLSRWLENCRLYFQSKRCRIEQLRNYQNVLTKVEVDNVWLGVLERFEKDFKPLVDEYQRKSLRTKMNEEVHIKRFLLFNVAVDTATRGGYISKDADQCVIAGACRCLYRHNTDERHRSFEILAGFSWKNGTWEQDMFDELQD